MKNNIVVVNEIIKYESNFDGSLRHGYNNMEEFKTDLIKSINEDGAEELLGYYKSYYNSCDGTNSIEEKRKELYNLTLMLEGFNN